jgi:hypothetical protein
MPGVIWVGGANLSAAKERPEPYCLQKRNACKMSNRIAYVSNKVQAVF